ncbi:cytochrome c oxidase assembly protein subunit 15 [Monaibacterium marinum]|uniref:Heme A synthase n=1 Tax=Pontivivens marinum TaxID=1690039 RepID=A0A2C9CQM3_9RHOB|nr:heme A synthase [Monaibacterium marinum]SOH93510.1 cytochrome c oxidase assembly protein subunit 15 [Monaibacterium marinum]
MANSRSIFEDVGTGTAASPPPAPRRVDDMSARRGIARWLGVLFTLVLVMIVVGGLTRLTDSGLSITEWKPLLGALPPMSAEAWASEFDKYRTIPEYQLQNRGMSLGEFKAIYWWEWGHRQLGRVIGLVWALGFVWFLARRKIPRGWTPRLLGVGALGGLQGFIGWWMVSSGLQGTMLDVASYRLATHLGLAFIILGLIAWYMLRLSRREADMLQARRQRVQSLVGLSGIFIVLLFGQILMGALVAGIDAGRSYTDWPMMAGQFFPPDAFVLSPLWTNFLQNPGLVQFNHRILAYIVAAFGLFVWLRARKSSLMRVRMAFNWLGALLVLQVVLGIITVMYGAPWYFAIAHQLLAVGLWVSLLRARFAAAYPPSQSVRG